MLHFEDIGNVPLFDTLFKENIEYMTSAIQNIQKRIKIFQLDDIGNVPLFVTLFK